jgi:hypothetical protein
MIPASAQTDRLARSSSPHAVHPFEAYNEFVATVAWCGRRAVARIAALRHEWNAKLGTAADDVLHLPDMPWPQNRSCAPGILPPEVGRVGRDDIPIPRDDVLGQPREYFCKNVHFPDPSVAWRGGANFG